MRSICALFLILTSCFGGPYEQAENNHKDSNTVDAGANQGDVNVDTDGPINPSAFECGSQGAIWQYDTCYHGVVSMFSQEQNYIAQRSDFKVVAWGRSDAMVGYSSQRENLAKISSKIRKVAISVDKTMSVLTENGHLYSWGNAISSSMDSLGTLKSVIDVVHSKDGNAALIDTNGDGTCDDGCTLVKLGGAQPTSEIINATKIVSHIETGVITAILTDQTVSYFGTTGSRWETLDNAENYGFVDVMVNEHKLHMGRRADGSIAVWGYRHAGTYMSSITSPITGIESFDDVYAGEYAVLAINRDGTLSVWGDEYYFNEDGTGVTSFTGQIDEIKDIKAIVAAPESTLLLRNDGKLIFWGENDYGKQILDAVGESQVKEIATTGYSFIALLEDNRMMIKGDDDKFNTDTPIENVAQFFVGNRHVIYQKLDGSYHYIGNESDYSGWSKMQETSEGIAKIVMGTSADSSSLILDSKLQVFTIGEGSILPVDITNPDRIYQSDRTRLYTTFTKGNKIYVNGKGANQELVDDLDTKNIVAIFPSEERLGIQTNLGVFYDIDFATNTRTTLEIDNVIDIGYTVNGFYYVQAKTGETDCSKGCTILPGDDFAEQTDALANDMDSSNDPVLTDIVHYYSYNNNIFLVDLNSNIYFYRDYTTTSESYIYQMGVNAKPVKFFLGGNNFVAITDQKTIVAMGSYVTNYALDCTTLSDCYSNDKALTNVVDVVPSYIGFTFLINETGDDCSTGCKATTWGRFYNLVDSSNHMNGADLVSDFTEVVANYTSVFGRRSDGSYIAWGSYEYGGDPSCSHASNSGNANCRSIGSATLSNSDRLFNVSPLQYPHVNGFLAINSTGIDYWGTYKDGYPIDDLTLSNIVSVEVKGSIGVILSSPNGNCNNGCQITFQGSAPIYEDKDIQGKVKKATYFETYWELELVDGSYGYLGVDNVDYFFSHSDYDLLQPDWL